jgi:GDP/UDP-N,N'-diacetylbacillosamine 2-epimerase (hydrolysing)
VKTICVVTGTRAEYGLLRMVMEGIQASPVLRLQIIATGMHLSPEFGMTIEAIKQDGYTVDYEVEMLLSSDTPVGVTKSMGLGMIGFADALAALQPDMVLVLGDRFELLSAVASAMIARIPVSHLHGGEKTEGAFDEAIRHSITKMSHLHFVALEEYRRRVIQLGEQPDKVFTVGGLGVDNIRRLKLLERDRLEKALDFNLEKRNLLITFHPVTLEGDTAAQHMDELLAALARLEGVGLIFTMPNADTEGRILFEKIEAFCATRCFAKAFRSLGYLRYLSCLKYADGVVGNSSSGLLEAPSFKKGTINIGDRQRGRIKASSVINCEPTRRSITGALKRLFSDEFQVSLREVKNPYGNGGASAAVVKILETTAVDGLLKKSFYDLR